MSGGKKAPLKTKTRNGFFRGLWDGRALMHRRRLHMPGLRATTRCVPPPPSKCATQGVACLSNQLARVQRNWVLTARVCCWLPFARAQRKASCSIDDVGSACQVVSMCHSGLDTECYTLSPLELPFIRKHHDVHAPALAAAGTILIFRMCIMIIFEQILYGVSRWPTMNSCIFNQNDM